MKSLMHFGRLWALMLICALTFLGSVVAQDPYPLMADDGTPWDFKFDGPVHAIGDIHGDPDALKQILRSKGLIDGRNRWVGGKSFLVLVGDLVDRGPDSLGVLRFVVNLQKKASAAGGQVEVLLGNHEIMVLEGDDRYIAPEDDGPKLYETLKNPRSDLGRWLRSLNTVIRVNDTLFVHAGVGPWLNEVDMGQLNSTLREFIRAEQGLVEAPIKKYEWILNGKGPLWNGAMSHRRSVLRLNHSFYEPENFKASLNQVGVRRLVVGHSIPEDMAIQSHPIYGDSFIMIDTGISQAMGGNKSSIAISGDRVMVQKHDSPRSKICEALLGE